MFRAILLALFFLPPYVGGIEFTFPNSNHQWKGDFADYPVDQEAFFELAWGWETLPTPITQKEGKLEKGLYLSGNNHSDDLFMFVRRKITQLKPNTKYALNFNVLIESDISEGKIGVGGSPGESVFFKVGASAEEPKKVAVKNFYFLNVDKGNQAQGGANALVIGNLANSSVDPDHPSYLPKELHSEYPLVVESSSKGDLWIFLGTDSGFEGRTKFYIAKVEVELVEAQ